MKKYGLDEEAAKRAGEGGRRITTPGVYVGKFTQAWYEKNERGTEGVFLTFESDTGQLANFRLYTHNADGEDLPSYKVLNATLAVLRLKSIDSKPGKVTKFDGKDDVEISAEVFPTMCGKPIGVLVQTEEYENRDGAVKTQTNLYAPFCTEKQATAAEVIARKVDGGLAKLIEHFEQVKHKPLKSGRSSGRVAPGRTAPSSGLADDDIPF